MSIYDISDKDWPTEPQGSDALEWARKQGICSASGGKHEFLGRTYCRMCRDERADLKRWAKRRSIFSVD